MGNRALRGLVSLPVAAAVILIAIEGWTRLWTPGEERPGIGVFVPALILSVMSMLIFWMHRAQASCRSRLRQREDALERLDAAFFSPAFSGNDADSSPTDGSAAAFAPVAALLPVRNLTLTVIDTSRQAIIDHFAANPGDISFSAADALTLAKSRDVNDPPAPGPVLLASRGRYMTVLCRFDTLVAVISYMPAGTRIMRGDDDDFLFMRGAVRRFLHNIDAQRKELERRATDQRLEHAERLATLGTITGGLAHEFNNILTAMRGFAERGLMSLSKKAADSQLENILEAGQRAAIIIDQILTMSRKRDRTIIKPISLREVISASEALIRISVPTRIMLDINVPDQTVTIDGNPVEIQQILMNLCRNACQSIASSGKIEIIVSQDEVGEFKIVSTGVMPPGRYAQISVVDTGAGIPETAMDQIFSPFFTTRAPTGGTGLGLSTVLRQVTALDGYINVSSLVGAGTRFDINIPLSTRQPVELASFFRADHVPLGKGETVVILCRDADDREMYEDKIAALGYEPLGFENNEKFQSWAGKGNIEDVILADIGTDLEMRQFLQCLQAESAERLILIANPGMSEHAQYADYLAKPMSSQALADALSRCVNKAGFPTHDPL